MLTVSILGKTEEDLLCSTFDWHSLCCFYWTWFDKAPQFKHFDFILKKTDRRRGNW